MDTLILSRKVKIAEPVKGWTVLTAAFYLAVLIGVSFLWQKQEGDHQALLSQLQTAYKNVEMKEAEKKVLQDQVSRFRVQMASLERRYDTTLQKSVAAVAEYKERLSVLQTKVENLKTERDLLQSRVIALENAPPAYSLDEIL